MRLEPIAGSTQPARFAGEASRLAPSTAAAAWLRRLGVASFAALALAAVFAPVLAPPTRSSRASHRASPGPPSPHLLGTDALGRDVLSRLLFGARLSLAVGAVATSFSLLIGVALGSLAGYGGATADEIVARLTDVFLAFPGLLLAIALAAVLGPSERNVILALAVMGWPTYARLSRAEVRAAAALDSTRAAEALGAAPAHIAVRHLIPAAAPALVVQAAFGMSGAIVAEASLSFLGLGAPPPTPSLGAMLAEGRSLLVVAPHLAIAPATALAITVLGLQLASEAIATALHPREVG